MRTVSIRVQPRTVSLVSTGARADSSRISVALLLYFGTLPGISASPNDTMSVADAFKKEDIVPDVVDKAPEHVVEVSYASGAKVSLGNELTPEQVKDQPSHIVWPMSDPAALYTLAMTDPDAPSRKDPKAREWHHWLVVNVPGNAVGKGDVLSEYVGSGPPQGTGLHRYVYLVYKQPGKVTDPDHGHLTNRSAEGRGKFSVNKFAQKHKLELVAGNFYQAQYDDYVPKLYEQLKG